MIKVRLKLLSSALVVTSVSAPALAQTAPETSADSGSDIVVTGSRLATTADQTPAPVLSVSAESLAVSGSDNLADALTDLGPVATGLSDNNSQNFYAAAGLNLVDLRKLGFDRTLVLINGRRVVPGDIDSSAVDLNIVPVPLIERVEVVTGGSSAVYGADAVAGVINVILRDNFDGLETRARGSITSRGDGEQYGLSVTGGHNFADGRGNVTVSALYDKVTGLKATARKYASDNLYVIDNPAIYVDGQTVGPGVPFLVHRTDVRYFGPNQLGLVNLYPFGANAAFTIQPGGMSVRPYDFGQLGTDVFGAQIGGDGGTFQKYDNLVLPLKRLGVSASLNYDLADDLEFFFEGRYINTKSQTRWQPVADFEYGTVAIKTANPFVPADLRAIISGFGSPILPFDRIYEDFGRRGANNERQTQQYTAGLNGKFGKFQWTAFAGYGRTGLHSHLVGGRDQDRFEESIDVVLLNGQPACASAAARANGCRPLNVFNPAATPDGIAYSLVETDYRAKQELLNAGANITGEVFDLPAGPVGVVLGVEARKNKISTNPSAAIRGCRVQLLCEDPIRGSVGVVEAFGELRVPILAERPFFHELTLQGAGRVSDYDTSGTEWTWNIGGVWAPVEDIRFRAMRSRAVRAPTPGALFLARSQTFLNLSDPCSQPNIDAGAATRRANCEAQGRPANFVASTGSKATFAGGNPDLDPEKGDTLTLGVTIAPRFAPRLRLTLDYYDIELDGAIAPLPASAVLLNCYDSQVSPTNNPSCDSIVRGANFDIVSVSSGFLNIGRVETSGIDFGLSYNFPLNAVFGAPGRFAFDLSGTWVDKLRYFPDRFNRDSEIVLEGNRPGQPGQLGGTPKWEFVATGTYTVDRLSLSWRTRFIDKVYLSTQYSRVNGKVPNLWDLPYTKVETFNDVSIGYDFNEGLNARFNINNIFDNKPPRRSLFSQGRDGGAIYPALGTTFSAVVTHRF